jgi:hypothetical protein
MRLLLYAYIHGSELGASGQQTIIKIIDQSEIRASRLSVTPPIR